MSDELNRLGLKPLSELRKEAETVFPELVEDDDEDEAPSSSLVEYHGSDELPAIPEPDAELLDDIEFAKNNIKTIIEVGTTSFHEIASVAKQTESPQAYDAQVKVMKALLEANRELISASKEKKFEKTEQPANHKQPGGNASVTNNILMTTEELLKMIGKK